MFKQLEEWNWNRKGRPVPPPRSVKARTVAEYGHRFSCPTLVETGTYKGYTLKAVLHDFKRIYSIELGKELAARARHMFRNEKHVTILEGDSSDELPKLIPQLTDRTLFWLDGHCSEGITARGKMYTPIMAEIEAIFAKMSDPVLLIDDARLFNGTDDYPVLENFLKFLQSHRPDWSLTVVDDIIRFHAVAST